MMDVLINLIFGSFLPCLSTFVVAAGYPCY